ncbi:MAG: ABC transporter substrate-binding protein [Sphingomonas fennica]
MKQCGTALAGLGRVLRRRPIGAAGSSGAIDAPIAPSAARPACAPIGPEPGRRYRIGIITYANLGMETPLKRELERLGYVEGRTVVYEGRAGNRDLAVMDRAAAELVAWRPDVIVSLMTNAHIAVQKATAENPIPVVLWSTDPLQTGVIHSFRRPGTNFTGFSYAADTQLLQMRFLKLAVPGLNCVGHLYNPTYAPAPSTLRALQAAGALLGVPVEVYEVLEREGLGPALAQMRADGCAAFVVGPHELFNGNGALIGRLALQFGLAAIGIQISITRGGGLATYAPPFERGWPAMAPVIDRLLHGADPADIPIERGFKSPLTINLGAARALGLTLPASLIDEADDLIA